MNKTIGVFWFFTMLLASDASPTHLKVIPRTRMSRTKTQTITEVRFTNEEDNSSLFDPSDLVSKCAKGSTFCETIDNYPRDELRSILKDSNDPYQELFGNDVLRPNSIGSRFEAVEDEEQLCSSQIRLVFPQAGLTQDNTWRFIVNQSNYTQGVSVDECIHTRECKMMQDLAIGYKAECKQKYVYRQLVAVDDEGNTIRDSFKIPSCCQCVLKRSFGKRN